MRPHALTAQEESDLREQSRHFADATEAARCGVEEFVPLPCPEPTEAMPGTREKVEVLEARMRAGVELYHPDDKIDWEK